MPNQDNNILISQCGGFHARSGVEATSKAGMLQKFITTHPLGVEIPKDKLLNLNFLFQPMRGFSLLNRISKSNFFSPCANLWEKCYKKIFTSVVNANINKSTKIFHAYSNMQESSLKKCSQQNIFSITEHGAAYPLYDAEVLPEEYKKLGLSEHPYLDVSGAIRACEEFDLADQVCIISNFAKKTFLQYGFSEDKLLLNPLGIDSEIFHPLESLQKDCSTFTVSTGGYICVRKGSHYLLEAVQGLKKQQADITLNLLGSPYYFDKIIEQYSDTFDHLGSVNLQSLIEHYNKSDVFILPSLSEGFGRVVLEAMACGTPCIVTENTGAGEVITDGVDGFIVPAYNTEAIQEKIELLYNDRELASQMGQRARETALRNNWKKYQDTLIDNYRKILATL